MKIQALIIFALAFIANTKNHHKNNKLKKH